MSEPEQGEDRVETELHITHLRWRDELDIVGFYSIDQMINYIRINGDKAVYCRGPSQTQLAYVFVNANAHATWVQTKADGRWSNNLLFLPTF